MQKELVYEQHLSLTTYSRTKTFLDPADTFIPSCFNKNIKSILIYLDPAAFYQFALKLETRLCNLRRIRDRYLRIVSVSVPRRLNKNQLQ